MSWADDLLLAIELVSCQEAMFEVVQRAASALGFDYCAYGVRVPTSVTSPKILMFNNYPLAWQDHYSKMNYLAVDPTVQRARSSEQPIVWDDRVFAPALNLWNDARDAGLHVGWAKSALEGHIGGMLTLARGAEPLTALELKAKEAQMRWLSHTAHHAFRKLLWTRWSGTLTRREKEVLQWAADGKTFSETSRIMEISIETVKFHTKNASEKLGTINRTATVARAVAMGLLN